MCRALPVMLPRPVFTATMVTGLIFGAASACAGQRCPLRFDAVTAGLPTACLFLGRYDPECGGQTVAVFAGDGKAIVVGLSMGEAQPVVYLPGRVESATEGTVVRWRPDLELREAEGAGVLTLEGEGGLLRLRLSGGALRVGSCTLREFVGDFAAMVDASPGTATASAATGR